MRRKRSGARSMAAVGATLAVLLGGACGGDDGSNQAAIDAEAPTTAATTAPSTSAVASAAPPGSCPTVLAETSDAAPETTPLAPTGSEDARPVLTDATGATVAWFLAGEGGGEITFLELDTGRRRSVPAPDLEPALAWGSGGLVTVDPAAVRWYPYPALDAVRVTEVGDRYLDVFVDREADQVWITTGLVSEPVAFAIDGATGEIAQPSVQSPLPVLEATGGKLLLSGDPESLVEWDPETGTCTTIDTTAPEPNCERLEVDDEHLVWACRPNDVSSRTELAVTDLTGSELVRATQAHEPLDRASVAPLCGATLAPDASAVVCGFSERNHVGGWYQHLPTGEVVDLPRDDVYFGNNYPAAFFVEGDWLLVFVGRDLWVLPPGRGPAAERTALIDNLVPEFRPIAAAMLPVDAP